MFEKLRILTTLLILLVSNAAFAELAIIAHPDTDTGELDVQKVRNLFLGERKAFPSGRHVVPFNHSVGSPDRKKFFDLVLNMPESLHKRHWKRKMAVGVTNSPAELSSYSAVLESVATTPGGISYIDARMVDDSVKVLLIISDLDDV